MLIHQFVLFQLHVYLYHERPKVERDATLHRQEVIQNNRSICYYKVILLTFFITFLSYNLKTTNFLQKYYLHSYNNNN